MQSRKTHINVSMKHNQTLPYTCIQSLRLISAFPHKSSIYFPKFLMTFFLGIDLFRVLYLVFFHRGGPNPQPTSIRGAKILTFQQNHKITILPLLFLSRRGAISMGEPWPDLPPWIRHWLYTYQCK